MPAQKRSLPENLNDEESSLHHQSHTKQSRNEDGQHKPEDETTQLEQEQPEPDQDQQHLKKDPDDQNHQAQLQGDDEDEDDDEDGDDEDGDVPFSFFTLICFIYRSMHRCKPMFEVDFDSWTLFFLFSDSDGSQSSTSQEKPEYSFPSLSLSIFSFR